MTSMSRSGRQPKQRRRTFGEGSSRYSDNGSERGSAIHLGTLDYAGGSEYGDDAGRERQRRMGSFLSCDGGNGYTRRGGSRRGGDHYNDSGNDGNYSRMGGSFCSQNGGQGGGRRVGGSFNSYCDGDSVYSRVDDQHNKEALARSQVQDTKESDMMEIINEEDDEEDEEGKDVEERRFGDYVQPRSRGNRPIGQTPVKSGALFYM